MKNPLRSIFDYFRRKSTSEPDKKTITQGYEDNRAFFYSGVDNSVYRNDQIYKYEDYKDAYMEHPTLYAAVNMLCRGVFGNGYEIVPVGGIAKPKEANKKALEDYFANQVHPIFTAPEIFYSAGADFFVYGSQIIEINPDGLLFSDIDFATLKPRINEKGLFLDDGNGDWVQIIDGQIVARLKREDVIWLRMLDKGEMIYPVPPLRPIIEYIEMSIFARQLNRERFLNSDFVGTCYELPESANQKKAEELKAYLMQEYCLRRTKYGKLGGSAKPYSPTVTYGGTKRNNELADTFKDINFVEMDKFIDQRIMMIYSLHPRTFGVEVGGLGQGGANNEAEKHNIKVYNYWQYIAEIQYNKQLVQNRLNIHDWQIRFKRNVYNDETERIQLDIENLGNMKNAGAIAKEEYRTHMSKYTDYAWMAEPMPEVEVIAIPEKEEEPEKPARSCEHTRQSDAKIRPMVDWNMRMVASDLDTGQEVMVDRTGTIIDDMFEDAKKRMIAAAKDGDIKFRLNLKYKSKLTDTMKKEGVTVFEDGQKDIKRQLKTRSIEIGNTRQLALDTTQKYIDMVKKGATLASESIAFEMEKEFNVAFNNAVAQKWSENRLMSEIQSAHKKLQNRFPATTQTIVTNFYNLGRQETIYSAGRKAVPKAQYNATLDDVTTARCEDLNSTIVDVDSEEFERLTPPLHFNCRSAWVPVTTIDIEDTPELGIDTDKKTIERILLNTPGFERHIVEMQSMIRSCFREG